MNDYIENIMSIDGLSGILNIVILGSDLWRWLVALVIVALAVYGSGFLTRLLGVKFVGRYFKQESIFEQLLAAITRPISIILVWIGIRIAISFLLLPESISDFINSAYTILLTVLFAWLLSSVYLVIHDKVVVAFLEKPESNIDPRIGPIIRGTVKVLIWLLAIVLGVSNAGYDIKAILAGLGIGGLAIALAGQDLIANIFGGLLLFLQRPFSVGSYVEVAGIKGWVQTIGFRTIVISDFYGHNHHIPNKACAERVVNIDDRTAYFVNGKLHLHHTTTREKLEFILERLEDVPKVDETVLGPKSWLTLESIGQYYFCIDFWYVVTKFTEDDKPRFAVEYDKLSVGTTKVHLEILRILEANDVKLALPVQIVHVDNNADQPESLFSSNAAQLSTQPSNS